MIVLGISGAVSHDPSAALFIDGELVAAAEEERFIRDKHAKGRYPYEATRFCLDFAGIDAADVDVVTFPVRADPAEQPGTLALCGTPLVRPGSGAGCNLQRQSPLPAQPRQAAEADR